MRKIVILFFALLWTLILVSCSRPQSANNFISIQDFSHKKDIQQYPGGITSGFINTSGIELKTIDDVVERAKGECTVQWDNISIYFDKSEEIWKIMFYKSEMLGGDQSVYMNHEGKTIRIVYGE